MGSVCRCVGRPYRVGQRCLSRALLGLSTYRYPCSSLSRWQVCMVSLQAVTIDSTVAVQTMQAARASALLHLPALYFLLIVK